MSFDRNGDGKLTRVEVPERMQGLFDRADADKDGGLSADELKQSAAAQSRPTAGMGGGEGNRDRREGEGRRGGREGRGRPGDSLVLVLDTNKDGAIAADEITGAARSLATLDRNGDGQLTMDEIAPAFHRGGGDRRPEYHRPESR
jgi:Ca2+-binding EF-hand superfamily protein